MPRSYSTLALASGSSSEPVLEAHIGSAFQAEVSIMAPREEGDRQTDPPRVAGDGGSKDSSVSEPPREIAKDNPQMRRNNSRETLRDGLREAPRETRETPRETRETPRENVEQQVTVETETVSTVPTLNVNLPMQSVRVKRSQESVPRPPSARGSQKKRSQRMAQGSRADFFAAKVADAVDEHESSSSDETFVYDTPQAQAATTAAPERRPYLRSSSDVSFYSQGAPNPPAASNYAAPAGGPNHGSAAPGVSPGTSGLLCAHASAPPSATPGATPGATTASSYFGEESQYESDATSDFPEPSAQAFRGANRPMVVAKYDDDYPIDSHWASQNQGNANRLTRGGGGSFSGGSGANAGPGYTAGYNSGYNSGHSSISDGRHARVDSSPVRDPTDSMRAKHTYLQRWRAPPHVPNFDDGAPQDDEERTSLLRGRPSLYNYHSSRSNANGRGWGHHTRGGSVASSSAAGAPGSPSSAFHQNLLADGVYAGERHPSGMSPAASYAKFSHTVPLTTRVVIGIVLMLIFLLSMVFVGGLVLAAGQPLSEFDVVSLSDVIVSDQELVFSLLTRARNPGMFRRSVIESELDVFATSSHTSELEDDADHAKKRTVLLGSVDRLETPMIFEGGLNSKVQWRTASAKLVNPLGNKTELWTDISTHNFDLTIKGVLKYVVLGNEYREAVFCAYHVSLPDLYENE